MNSGIEPAIGIAQQPRTTSTSESPTATVMTSPLAQTFAMAISKGVSGMTSRWSIVPCSRSRMTAAPARMIASIVTLLMMPMMLVNHAVLTFGLKATRTASPTGGGAHDFRAAHELRRPRGRRSAAGSRRRSRPASRRSRRR